jgi:hypothetical protein
MVLLGIKYRIELKHTHAKEIYLKKEKAYSNRETYHST